MQDFGKRIGWTRLGMFVSAILLVVTGVMCFVNHEIMPEPMHNTGLSGELLPGNILGAVTMFVTGLVLVAAFKMAGGSRNLSGFMFLHGIFALFCALAVITDPIFGTLTYEWVVAVLFGIYGAILIVEGIFASRLVGYKGWWLQVLVGLVQVALAVGVLLDSSYAVYLAGGALIAGAVEIAAIPLLSSGMKVEA